MRKFRSITVLLLGLTMCLQMVGTAQAGFLSSAYEGQVGVVVAAYPTAVRWWSWNSVGRRIAGGANILVCDSICRKLFFQPCSHSHVCRQCIGQWLSICQRGKSSRLSLGRNQPGDGKRELRCKLCRHLQYVWIGIGSCLFFAQSAQQRSRGNPGGRLRCMWREWLFRNGSIFEFRGRSRHIVDSYRCRQFAGTEQRID